jgi:hypothetical protein
MKKPEKDTYLSPVPNNPRDNKRYVDKKLKSQEDKFNRENMLFGATEEKFLKLFRKIKTEGRYGYSTAAGHWKDRDEPDAAKQERQADAINKMLQQKKAAVGKDRLKAQNKVPIRTATGKKLFEQFCKEAYKDNKTVINHADIENIYNAARHLSYEKWLWFMWDTYGNGKL